MRTAGVFNHSRPDDTDRSARTEQSCVNGFKNGQKDVFKMIKNKEHLTNFELVVKTKWKCTQFTL